MEANLSVIDDLPLADLIDDFLAAGAAKGLSKKSLRKYQIALTRFLDFYAGPLAAIDNRLLRRYIFDLQSSGLSAATVHDYFGILRIFGGYLVAEGVIDNDPIRDIPAPRKGKRLPKVLSEAQSQSLLDACPDWTWYGRRDRAAIFLLLGSGLRLSELLSLNLYDVDLESAFLRVIGKGDKERRVPLDNNVIASLREWLSLRERVLAGQPQNALFINRSRKRMGDIFADSVKENAQIAGFYCTPHILRHTFATNWIRNGGDSTTLRDILGHSHISITEQYIHLARMDFVKAANRYSITTRLRHECCQLQLKEE